MPPDFLYQPMQMARRASAGQASLIAGNCMSKISKVGQCPSFVDNPRYLVKRERPGWRQFGP